MIFFTLSRLEKEKNIEFAIEIFKDFNKNGEYELLIVGDGSQKKKLQKKAKGEKIRFVGWINDPWEILCKADCLLFPSLTEGYGLAPMEAHKLGIPVIMNDVGCANYELQAGWNVFITPLEKDLWLEAMGVVASPDKMAMRYCLFENKPMIICQNKV